MLTIEQKIELANWIVTHNEHMCLSGSLSLYIRCQQLGIPFIYDREPNDIDILVDYNYVYNNHNIDYLLPPFITEVIRADLFHDNKPVIVNAIYDDVHIEFFIVSNYIEECIKDTFNNHFISNNNCFNDSIKQYKLAPIFNMLGAKQLYINTGRSKSNGKHSNDINILINFIEKYKYDWENIYIKILMNYINNNVYIHKFDYLKFGIENYIETYIVKDDPKLIEWFNYLKNIEHSDLIHKENKVELLEKIIRTKTLC